ncbi:hypothetical protein [Sphingomonas sp. CFBP 13720]|uniref:hypothetical protein n=1 Tax=Sphingomonas sp. CFBP 13720 TaxID=2775302 RepID=UPI001784CBE1|nr:hypothetical protein [Sphingomonas sp. CFBP 13720]MBD8678793.1 hypothetical protein [Sphingomonas sp. CFBP 13720]
MKIDSGAACREALGIWRRDRDVIVAVAGVFFFLPTLAAALFMTTGGGPPAGDVAPEEAIRAYADVLSANAHWFILQLAAELTGIGVLLALLLDPARPTVGAALRDALRRLPILIAAMVVVSLAKVAGFFMLFVPMLYVIGRVFVVLPVLMAERERSFGDAIRHAVALTHGNVLQLLSLSGLIFFTGQMVVLLLSATARIVSSGGGNPVTAAMLAAAVAAVGSAMTIAFTLVRATVYRALSSKG